MPPSDEDLLALGEAVADRAAVDWDDAARRARDKTGRDLIRELRVIAAVAESHGAASNAPERAGTDDAGAPREQIGPYRILRRLGAGGMGTVYLAEQTEPLPRRVALKLIRHGVDVRSIIHRFESERRTLARMEHPCIAQVYDAGTTEDGRPYFVMEYVDGLPVTDYCDEQKLDISERLELFARVCDGIQHAHQKGIIHRDIKPSNLLIKIEEGVAVPKIIDFGIAKAVGPEPGERPQLTRTGQVIGTPEYMSPEQSDPFGGDVDTRSDVYSAGLVLYELLTGVLPFDRSPGAAGRTSFRRLHDDPPQPSARLLTLGERAPRIADERSVDVRTLRRRLRGDLDWIVLKTLERDRGRRYGGASDLGQDLRRHLADEPVSAGPPTALYRARKYVRRHTAFVATASAVAFLIEVFGASDPLEVGGGGNRTARQLLDAGAERIRTELVDEPAVRGELLTAVGQIYINLGFYDRAQPLLEEALALRIELHGPRHLEVAHAQHRLAESLRLTSDGAGARRLFAEALELREELAGPDDPMTAIGLRGLAHIELGKAAAEPLLDRARYAEAATALERSIAISEKSLGPEHVAVGDALLNLAGVQRSMGNYAATADTLRRTIGIFERHDEQGERLARAYQNLGATLYVQRAYDESTRWFREALELKTRAYGPENTDLVNTLTGLGVVLQAQGQYVEAERLFRRSLALAERGLGPEHSNVGTALHNLAMLLHETGDLAGARDTAERALAVRVKAFAPNHPTPARTMVEIGRILASGGEFVEADKILREALRIQQEHLGPEHPHIASTKETLAQVTDELAGG